MGMGRMISIERKQMGLRPHVIRFKDQIEATVARSVRPGQAGRKKAAGGLSGEQVSLRFEEEAKWVWAE